MGECRGRDDLVDVNVKTENKQPAAGGKLKEPFVVFAPLLDSAELVPAADKPAYYQQRKQGNAGVDADSY